MSVNLSTSPRGLWMTSDKNDGPGKMCIKLRILLNTLNKKPYHYSSINKKKEFLSWFSDFLCTLYTYSILCNLCNGTSEIFF